MFDIVFTQITKHYGAVAALQGFSACASSGRVTAFLGPNGSGKTTSMRILLGLASPDSGSATVAGRPYRDLAHPLRTVGAVLDQGFHPRRSARNHLRIIAAQAAVPASRIDTVLDLAGLTEAGSRWVGGFSLGMRQRLALASAVIGDPSVLILDEPFNGLDPAGIRMVRTFLRGFAGRGGTVLLSSHLLAEVGQVAEEAIVIDRGRLVASGALPTLGGATAGVVVTTADADRLASILWQRGASVTQPVPNEIVVTGASQEEVGRAAADTGAVITEMHAGAEDLELVFQDLIDRREQAS
jgi:ABC-2 type transport system ATP-binding protein